MEMPHPLQPPGPLSPDGRWRWDGQAWQAVGPPEPPAHHIPPPPPPTGPSEITLLGPDVAAGVLPGVCVVTGRPTEARLRRTFSTTPPIAMAGCALGILGFLVTYLIFARRLHGSVPIAAELLAKRRQRHRAAWVCIALCLVCFIVAAIVSGPSAATAANIAAGTLMGAGLVLMLAATVLFVMVGMTIGLHCRVVDDTWGGRGLHVMNAHPDFIAALNDWHARRVLGYGVPAGTTRAW